MLAAAENHCTALHRSAIGGLTLESLGIAEGKWCYLDQAQLELLVPAKYHRSVDFGAKYASRGKWRPAHRVAR